MSKSIINLAGSTSPAYSNGNGAPQIKSVSTVSFPPSSSSSNDSAFLASAPMLKNPRKFTSNIDTLLSKLRYFLSEVNECLCKLKLVVFEQHESEKKSQLNQSDCYYNKAWWTGWVGGSGGALQGFIGGFLSIIMALQDTTHANYRETILQLKAFQETGQSLNALTSAVQNNATLWEDKKMKTEESTQTELRALVEALSALSQLSQTLLESLTNTRGGIASKEGQTIGTLAQNTRVA